MLLVNLLILFLKIVMQDEFNFVFEADKFDDELDWIFFCTFLLETINFLQLFYHFLLNISKVLRCILFVLQ